MIAFVLLFVGGAITPVSAQPLNFVLKRGALGSGDGQFNEPSGLAVNGSGNVCVADSFNHRIQKFTNT